MNQGGLVKAVVIGGVIAILAFLFGGLIVISSVMSNATTTAAATGGGSLNTAKVSAALVAGPGTGCWDVRDLQPQLSQCDQQYIQWVEEAGSECSSVSPAQIAAQIQQESAWQPDAVSGADAEGIAQFLSSTWTTYGRADASGPLSPFNPGDAIMAMGRFDCAIASAVAQVPGDPVSNMLAGYNAGIGNVLLFNGVPPFAQTQQYVANIEAMIPEFSSGTSTVTTVSDSQFAQAEIAAAEQYLGVPYVYGGGNYAGPTGGLGSTANCTPNGTADCGFDCSGLVMYAAYQASGGKIQLEHLAESDAFAGVAVPKSQIAPGDIVAIQDDPSEPGYYGHVVIYIGSGMIIQAPQPGQDVDIIPLSEFGNDVEAVRWLGGSSAGTT